MQFDKSNSIAKDKRNFSFILYLKISKKNLI